MDDRPAAEAATDEVETTAPPRRHEKTGVAMDGDYPHNHRLRAEALARDEKTEDPDGIISPELIADAKARLERAEEARQRAEEAEREAHPPVNARMPVADLEAIAGREGVDLSGAANNDDRVALIEAHRAETANPPPPGGATETPSEEA